eukprot:5162600-Amphidinium_carterae.1
MRAAMRTKLAPTDASLDCQQLHTSDSTLGFGKGMAIKSMTTASVLVLWRENWAETEKARGEGGHCLRTAKALFTCPALGNAKMVLYPLSCICVLLLQLFAPKTTLSKLATRSDPQHNQPQQLMAY